jgi:hypothetical protein
MPGFLSERAFWALSGHTTPPVGPTLRGAGTDSPVRRRRTDGLGSSSSRGAAPSRIRRRASGYGNAPAVSSSRPSPSSPVKPEPVSASVILPHYALTMQFGEFFRDSLGCFRLRLLSEKDRRYVAIVEVLRNIPGNNHLVGFELIEITAAHFSGNLEADMQELPEAGVVSGISRIMAQCGGELLRCPEDEHRWRGADG